MSEPLVEPLAASPGTPPGAGPAAIRHVVIWPANMVGSKWLGLFEALRRRHGTTCSLLCTMAEDEGTLCRQWGDRLQVVQSVASLYSQPLQPIEDHLVEREAAAYESRFDTLMVDLLQSDRHLGLAYAAGGALFTRSALGMRTSYCQSLQMAMRFLDFFDRYLEEQRPSLVLMEGVASLHTKCLVVAARRRGIPVRLPTPARYENWAVWAGNEYFETPWVTSAYRALPRGPVAAIPRPRHAYHHAAREMRRQQRMLTLAGTMASCGRDVAKAVYQRMVGYRPYAGYKLTDRLAYRCRGYWRQRMLAHDSFHDISALDGVRYVFLPLQHEPEGSLSVMAPEFNHQAGIIDVIAKSLPAGVRLVVKEHQTSGISARPIGFHRWIRDLPNVLLASMYLPSFPLIERSRAVVVITGTAGFEAALMGVPVISFGRHNFYNPIPHVHVVDQFSRLRLLFRQLCDDTSLAANADRQAEAQRFVAALAACAVDLGEDTLFFEGGHLSDANAEAMVKRLEESLRHPC